MVVKFFKRIAVPRRWRFLKGNLVLSTESMMQVSHRKEFLKLTFQALALPVIRSKEELLNALNVEC